MNGAEMTNSEDAPPQKNSEMRKQQQSEKYVKMTNAEINEEEVQSSEKNTDIKSDKEESQDITGLRENFQNIANSGTKDDVRKVANLGTEKKTVILEAKEQCPRSYDEAELPQKGTYDKKVEPKNNVVEVRPEMDEAELTKSKDSEKEINAETRKQQESKKDVGMAINTKASKQMPQSSKESAENADVKSGKHESRELLSLWNFFQTVANPGTKDDAPKVVNLGIEKEAINSKAKVKVQYPSANYNAKVMQNMICSKKVESKNKSVEIRSELNDVEMTNSKDAEVKTILETTTKQQQFKMDVEMGRNTETNKQELLSSKKNADVKSSKEGSRELTNLFKDFSNIASSETSNDVPKKTSSETKEQYSSAKKDDEVMQTETYNNKGESKNKAVKFRSHMNGAEMTNSEDAPPQKNSEMRKQQQSEKYVKMTNAEINEEEVQSSEKNTDIKSDKEESQDITGLRENFQNIANSGTKDDVRKVANLGTEKKTVILEAKEQCPRSYDEAELPQKGTYDKKVEPKNNVVEVRPEMDEAELTKSKDSEKEINAETRKQQESKKDVGMAINTKASKQMPQSSKESAENADVKSGKHESRELLSLWNFFQTVANPGTKDDAPKVVNLGIEKEAINSKAKVKVQYPSANYNAKVMQNMICSKKVESKNKSVEIRSELNDVEMTNSKDAEVKTILETTTKQQQFKMDVEMGRNTETNKQELLSSKKNADVKSSKEESRELTDFSNIANSETSNDVPIVIKIGTEKDARIMSIAETEKQQVKKDEAVASISEIKQSEDAFKLTFSKTDNMMEVEI